MHAIKEREGEEAEKMMSILETPYLYNYNMLIARKEVFDELRNQYNQNRSIEASKPQKH